MTIQEYLSGHKILAQGAMGTYYSQKTKKEGLLSELANFKQEEVIKNIHKEYLEAGVNLLLTNTFSANKESLSMDMEGVAECIKKAIKIGREAIQERNNTEQLVFLAGDIGPIPENGDKTKKEVLQEYKEICDVFLQEEVSILVFETFVELNYIRELVPYIKEKKQDIFLIVNCCVNKNGYARSGIRYTRLLEELIEMDGVDACGLNCGVGSGHMLQLLQQIPNLLDRKYIMIAPNAGYPEQLQNRMVFLNNSNYFSDNMSEISKMNVAILGGCCGTTPSHIKKLREKMDTAPACVQELQKMDLGDSIDYQKNKKKNAFWEKFSTGNKVIAVELDPPYDGNYDKVMECAQVLKKCNVDMITIADSPMGRSRVDSILMGVKIANEIGMPVMPHLCCRDKNMIAMRSSILGAYVNGIRNFLLVTGDPVPSENRKITTSVFDYHSIHLMQFVKEMNEEHFVEEPLVYGGALNYGRGKIDIVVERMKKKIEAGASYFLTQPIYSDEDIERIRQIKERVDTKILCGIMPLVSYRNANFIKNEMTGINVPDEIIERYHPDMDKEEAEWVGAQVVNEIIEKLSPYADGYYFMLPFNRVSLMEKIKI